MIVGVRRSTFEAIGTQWDVQTTDAVANTAWQSLLDQIAERIAAFDMAYSRFRSDSLVAKWARQAGMYVLPEEGWQLLRLYERLYELTDGHVTPLIGQTMADAGYDASYSFVSQSLQPVPAWKTVLSYDTSQLTLRQPALLDFGAVGKGYLVDRIGDLMEQAGVVSYTINAGGDILHRSAQHDKLTIGLENPQDPTEVLGMVTLSNQSLCASAGSRRKWGNFHHIMDPYRLQAAERVIATWVMAADTMTADGLATALFFTPPQRLLSQFTFSYALLDNKMGLQYAEDFPVQLFEDNTHEIA